MQNRKFILNTDELAVSASQICLDMYNPANSGDDVLVQAIYAIPKTDVAVTGVVSARFNIFRTTSAGTSGQSIGYAATSAGKTISPLDSENTYNSNITARVTPTGGAANGAFITHCYPFPEETADAAQSNSNQNILGEARPLVLHEGQGLAIKQGSVASVGSFTFIVVFELRSTN